MSFSFSPRLIWLAAAFFFFLPHAVSAAEQAATKEDAPKVVVTPLPENNATQPLIDSLVSEENARSEAVGTPQAEHNATQILMDNLARDRVSLDPRVTEIEERIMRYKFILENLGFSLEEIILAPDTDYKVELIFQGRLNAAQEKLDELAQKFKDEIKLITLLQLIYDYSTRDLTNYAAYKIILRLSEPVSVEMYYRKF